jgi:hypothetical protein
MRNGLSILTANALALPLVPPARVRTGRMRTVANRKLTGKVVWPDSSVTQRAAVRMPPPEPTPRSTRCSVRSDLANEELMKHLRYVVVRREGEWRIVQGGRLWSGSYPGKRQALCAAIEFGEQDGRAGRRVEVLVGHEDGHFLTEWIFGRDPRCDDAARPIVTPSRK